MWLLKSKDGSYIYLKPGKTITFGRIKCDVSLNDQSVSRCHASVTVTPKQELVNSEATSTCTLRDLNSKYGTYVIENNEPREIPDGNCDLKDKDTIRLGLQDCIYFVVHVPFLVVMSGLTENDKKILTTLIHEIDGFVSESWTAMCTHLTVAHGTLTEKVAFAMLSLKPIVTTEYWAAVKRSIDSLSDLPNAEDYVPSIGEKFVHRNNVSLLPNVKRQELFKQLIFIFFTRHQYRRFGKLIMMGGGKSMLYGAKNLTTKQLCLPNVVLIQYINDTNSQSTQTFISDYDAIYEALQQEQRRMVPDTEILLAILDCSVTEYCNPKYNFCELLKRKDPVSVHERVIAPDSQDTELNSSTLIEPVKPASEFKAYAKIIPETLEHSVKMDFEDESCNANIVNDKTINTVRTCIPETPDCFDSCPVGLKSVSTDNDIVSDRKKHAVCLSLDFPDESLESENNAPNVFGIIRESRVEKFVERDKPFISEECTSTKKLSIDPEAAFRVKDSSQSSKSQESPSESECFTKVTDVPGNIIPETPNDVNEQEDENMQIESKLVGKHSTKSPNEPEDESIQIESKLAKEQSMKTPNKRDVKISNMSEAQNEGQQCNRYNVSDDGFLSTPKKRCSSRKQESNNPTLPVIIEDKIVRAVHIGRNSTSTTTSTNLQLPSKFETHSNKHSEKRNENMLNAPQSKCSEVCNVEISEDWTSVSVDKEGYITCKKKPRSENLCANDLTEPEQNAAATEIKLDPVCKTTYTSSFLRSSRNVKRFKKVYNNYPSERITLSNMSVWTDDIK